MKLTKRQRERLMEIRDSPQLVSLFRWRNLDVRLLHKGLISSKHVPSETLTGELHLTEAGIEALQ